jgi:hypothetical protein
VELTRDIYLRGTAWATAVQSLSDIFRTRTNYSLFMLSLSLGIMYDKRIKDPDMGEVEDHNPPSVPRNVLQNQANINGKLDFLFQAAILSTRTESLSEDERLTLAFGESTDFNKLGFLLEFANYGVTRLIEKVGVDSLQTMDQINEYLAAIVEGRDLDIDGLPDDVALDELAVDDVEMS